MMNNSENNIKNNNFLFQIVITLLRWKKFIIINFLIVLIASTIIAFMLPAIYYSSASVLPPKEEMSLLGGSGLGGLSSVMKEFSTIKNIGNLGNKSTYNYLVILNSRELAVKVIKKFNLIEAYGQGGSLEKTLKIFWGNAIFEVQEEGNLEIGYFDENPQRAADIANYLVTALNERSYEMSMLESSNNRKFLEKRVADNMDSLSVAENQLKAYQEKHEIFIPSDQVGALVESGSKVYAEKITKEIEMDYLKSVLSPDNSLLSAAQMQLNAINKQVNDLPTVGIEYFRLYRNVVIRTKILEFLRPMLEQSIYQEKKDVPVIVVVDSAIVPEYKAKPKRIIVIGSSILGWLMVVIIFIFLLEKWRSFKNTDKEKYSLLKDALR